MHMKCTIIVPYKTGHLSGNAHCSDSRAVLRLGHEVVMYENSIIGGVSAFFFFGYLLDVWPFFKGPGTNSSICAELRMDVDSAVRC